MSKIVNPAAGNRYFDISGNAIDSTNQPNVNGGAVAGILATSIDHDKLTGYSPVYANYSGVDNGQITHMMGVDLQPRDNMEDKGDQAREEWRVVKTATAIRNNQWNQYSGNWTVAPTGLNEAVAVGLADDNAASPDHKTHVTYTLGGVPVTETLS